MELFIFFFVTRFIVFVDNFWLRTSVFQSRAYHDAPVGIVEEETFRGLSAKALLKAYQDNFEQDKPQNGPSTRGGFRGGPRKRGFRGGSRGGAQAGNPIPRQVPVVQAEPKDPTIEDHSDKQWSDSMMSNLLRCNQLVSQRQVSGDKGDLATLLHEEWLKIYPHSTLNARNIKSRLTVYLKTMGHETVQPPAPKKRKIEPQNPPPPAKECKDEHKAKLKIMLEKVKNDHPEAKQEDLLTLLHQEWIKSESAIVSLTDIRNTVFAKKSENGSEIVSVKEEVLEDEGQPKSYDVEKYSICDHGHWVHLFSDKDVNVECILTEQLLQIRNSFKDTFQVNLTTRIKTRA